MSLREALLIKEFGYFEGIAQAVVNADGHCVYCREDLLQTRLGYSSITMDHLLPKSLHPELAWEKSNHVLACSSCNGMKGNYNPLQAGEVGAEMLSAQQSQLIERVRSYLAVAIQKRRSEWERVKQIVREAPPAAQTDGPASGGPAA